MKNFWHRFKTDRMFQAAVRDTLAIIFSLIAMAIVLFKKFAM